MHKHAQKRVFGTGKRPNPSNTQTLADNGSTPTPIKAVVERVCDENLQRGARCIRLTHGHGARACSRKILQHKFFNRR
jgi:hypothetical protein